jgi:hypothetical protein
MTTYVPLDLSSKEYRITANAGNDLNFAFVFKAVDTTGFTFDFYIYDAEGTLIATLTEGNGLTNTPGVDSIVAVVVGVAINPKSRQGTQLNTEFWRTDPSNVRTFAEGPIVFKPKAS